MDPEFINGNVRAHCPDCGGAVTTFEHRDVQKDFGLVIVNGPHQYADRPYSRVLYFLLRCAGCQRGGLAKIHDNGNTAQGVLESFFPISIERAHIPEKVPEGILTEFLEAELCAASGAWRAASALLRSVLEKTLRANGYTKGSLKEKIDEAGDDGVITEARKKRAHEDIRVLDNDILHDEWRKVGQDEFAVAHKYAQRILEDLYDDRESVETILKIKKRLQDTQQFDWYPVR